MYLSACEPNTKLTENLNGILLTSGECVIALTNTADIMAVYR